MGGVRIELHRRDFEAGLPSDARLQTSGQAFRQGLDRQQDEEGPVRLHIEFMSNGLQKSLHSPTFLSLSLKSNTAWPSYPPKRPADRR